MLVVILSNRKIFSKIPTRRHSYSLVHDIHEMCLIVNFPYTMNKESHQRISNDVTQLTFAAGLHASTLNKNSTGLKLTLKYDHSDSIFAHRYTWRKWWIYFGIYETDNFLTHVTQTVLTKGNVSIVLFINSLINPRKENIIRFYCTCLGADRKCKMPAG